MLLGLCGVKPDEARRLLETTDLTIDQIAASCGFGNTMALRRNFASAFGSTVSFQLPRGIGTMTT